MHRVRLLFLLGLLFALSATPLVRAQDATSGLDQNKTVAPDTKPEQAKDKGHRKHWWSLPHVHLHHKKNKKDSGASQTDTKMSSSSKAVAQTPVNTAAARTNPAGKTMAAKPVKTKTAHATRARRRTVARTRTHHKTVARRTHARRRRVARRRHGKKAVQNGCTTAASKKGGCQADKTSKKKTAKS